jgi:aminoglycoside N3'-acetyltransferase
LFDQSDERDALKAHFNVLADLLDLNEGTLVVPTGCVSLCNTKNPFDPKKTPSEHGVLTEYIRKKKKR